MNKNKGTSIKLIIICTLVFIALAGCGNNSANKISGKLMSGASLYSEDGKSYGFVVDENTKLIWKDKNLYNELVEEAKSEITSSLEYDIDEWHFVTRGMKVSVELGEKTGNKMHLSNDLMVESYVAKSVTVIALEEDYINPFTLKYAKPVIYLYPEMEEMVSVELDYAGKLTCTYPEYNDGWEVLAAPDGTLTDRNGQTYNYLYWEGISGAAYDFSEGYCVAGEDTAAFLEDALAKLGLNRREANEFIVYWLPLMQENPYNIISFQTEVYTEAAKLYINPEPDTVIRVFMAWQGSEAYVKLPKQELSAPESTGFTVVEWGGAEIK